MCKIHTRCFRCHHSVKIHQNPSIVKMQAHFTLLALFETLVGCQDRFPIFKPTPCTTLKVVFF